MLTRELLAIMHGKCCGLCGCGTDQEVQDTVTGFSGQMNERKVLSSPSRQFED